MAFIGFKVSAMAPFSPLWLIITFMHDLRWQCRTRKTRLKFNHFLIYVFMQPEDDHERNIAMSLRWVWYESRALQHSCCAGKSSDLTRCTTDAQSDRCFSCIEGCKSLQRSVEVNVRYSVLASTRVTAFRMLKVEHLHGQHASASSGEQTRITAVNTVLSSFPSSLILYPLPRKRHLEAPAQVSRQLFWIQTPEYDQLESRCSAPLVRVGIHQCLVYLCFPTCQKRSE